MGNGITLLCGLPEMFAGQFVIGGHKHVRIVYQAKLSVRLHIPEFSRQFIQLHGPAKIFVNDAGALNMHVGKECQGVRMSLLRGFFQQHYRLAMFRRFFFLVLVFQIKPGKVYLGHGVPLVGSTL